MAALLSSKKMSLLGSSAKFQSAKLSRFISILFKRRKNLELTSLRYYSYWRFENACLVVHIACKNAIWVKIAGIKKTDFTQPVILNLQCINTNSITLEVYGFFQKQIYKIDVKKQAGINSLNFNTHLKAVNSIIRPNPNLQVGKPLICRQKPYPTLPSITIHTPDVFINNNHFKLQDYI